jgi:single-strand DNA-binding protein
MDLNRVTLLGNLAADPVARKLPTGKTFVQFSVATEMGRSKKDVEFHNVVAWGKLGEIVATYLKKGNRVYVEGQLKTRRWQDKVGNKRYKTEVVANNLIMLGPKSKKEPQDEGVNLEVVKTEDVA